MSAEQQATTAPINSATEEETHKVFIGNLSFTSTDESLKTYFKDAGEVLETIIIKKGSRPKGFGFVAFRTVQEAEKAVKLFDKKELDGREISVQLAIQRTPEELKASNEAKKKKLQQRRNKLHKKSRKSAPSTTSEEEDEEEQDNSNKENVEPVASVSTTASADHSSKPKTSVFVANLPLSVKKDDLADLFKDYQVESVLVAIQRSGRSKGYGFVELKTVEEMERVLKDFVDVEVQGRPLHISAATSEKNLSGERSASAVHHKTKRSPKKMSPPKKEEGGEEIKEAEKTASATEGGGEEQKKKKKSSNNRNRKNKKTNKEKEGIAAAHEAQEAVVDLKKEDGVHAAHEAQDAVKELKKEDGVEAAKAANKA